MNRKGFIGLFSTQIVDDFELFWQKSDCCEPRSKVRRINAELAVILPFTLS